MELYILDNNFRRYKVIDKFESLIWTERWQAYGDFELDIHSNVEHRSDLRPDVKLACNNSYRVMQVEIVEDRYDNDGKKMLKVKGKSIEGILEDRTARQTMDANNPSWAINGAPRYVAATIFNHLIRPPAALTSADELPNLSPVGLIPPGNIPEPTDTINWYQETEQPLYDVIQKICIDYDLGFRFVRNFDAGTIHFELYMGNRLTSKQTALPPVIFSAKEGSLKDVSEYQSILGYKNVAQVFTDTHRVAVTNISPDPSGFARRVLPIRVSIDPEDPDPVATLQQIGYAALKDHRRLYIIDGEADQNSGYVYGVHYNLGDIVELRNPDDVVVESRVAEQIFVHDVTGERSYPTLTVAEAIELNTWLSWGSSPRGWGSLPNPDIYWDEM